MGSGNKIFINIRNCSYFLMKKKVSFFEILKTIIHEPVVFVNTVVYFFCKFNVSPAAIQCILVTVKFVKLFEKLFILEYSLLIDIISFV